MSRISALIITLKNDIPEDNIENIKRMFLTVENVISVEPILSDFNQQIGQSRADNIWREKLSKLIKESL